jgi:hypothetical protein
VILSEAGLAAGIFLSESLGKSVVSGIGDGVWCIKLKASSCEMSLKVKLLPRCSRLGGRMFRVALGLDGLRIETGDAGVSVMVGGAKEVHASACLDLFCNAVDNLV